MFIFFIILCIGFIAACIILYLKQESLLFHPTPLQQPIQQWIADTYPNSDINISTAEGITLQGWLLKKPSTEKQPLIIYFGGNGEEVSGTAYHFEKFTDHALLLINYRGFGESEGQPSQEGLFNDALAIYDYISQHEDIDKQRIIAMGRSLGTGIAVHLAAHRPLQGVILASPYDSITRVAQRHVPILPISFLIKHPFNSIALAPSITTPLLSLVAQQDTLIPPKHSYNLTEKWGGDHELQLITFANHDNIPDNDIYWNAINQFLAGFKK